MNRAIFLLAGLHLLLALLFAAQTPYRAEGRLRFQGGAQVQDVGAPDERQHANYIAHLASGKGFPVFNPKDPNLYETYQSHQPPLYYLLGTGVAKVTGQNPADQSAKMPLRGLNALIGVLGVFGAFFLGRWTFGRDSVALGAATLYALLPMNVALSGAISNDPLLIALSTWALAFLVRGGREGWTPRLAVMAGALIGLAILTKSNGIALLLPALIALGFGWSKTTNRPAAVAAALAPILVIAGPWLMRNQSLYGDPLALRAFTEAFVGSAQAKDLIAALGPWGYWSGANDAGVGVGWWTLRSLLGAFGYMDIFLPSPLVTAFAILLLVCFVGWILAKPDPESEARYDVRKVLPFVHFVVVLLLFMRFNAQYFQAQARYLLPALGGLSVGVGAGLERWVPRYGWMILAGVLLWLNLWIGFALLPNEFASRVL